jgi:digeranylgeranylglycerophospholipid reductase
MKSDVLVVGASPAGIAAGISAASTGSDVILIDKDLDGMDHPANTLLYGMASRAGLDVEESYVQRSLEGMRIISPSGHSLTITARGCLLDRRKFDEHYLRRAEEVGIRLLKDEALGMQLREGRRLVFARQSQIEAGVVIDASGVPSALASKADMNPMRHPQDVAWAMEAQVRCPGLGEEDHFEYWIGSMAPGWKATFSPGGGDRAALGVFVRGHGRNVQPFFWSFLKRFQEYKSRTYKRIADLEILSINLGGDPIAVLPGELVSDGFMITGGAAGQSGLAYSMRAGAICGAVAGEAALSGDVSGASLNRYVRLWRSELGLEYRIARSCLETLRRLRDEEIDQLVRGLSGKDLLPEGSLYRKALRAGLAVASVRPAVMVDLIRNLVIG